MNHHFANAGDVMKHLALMRVVELVRPVRYLEAHSGAFDYPLKERGGSLPDGVWDFIEHAPAVRALDDSSYLRLLREAAGTPESPGIYPGSLRCVWELLGASAVYCANDTDTEALASVGFALTSRRAQGELSGGDGIDMVIDEAKAGDLVLIDPFDPEAKSPGHRLSAREAFDALVKRGVVVVLWRALHGQPDEAPPVVASDLSVVLVFEEPTGSMAGCELLFGNIGPDVAAEVARLAVAHGAVLRNGRSRIASAQIPRVEDAKDEEPMPARRAQSVGSLFDRYVMIDWSASNQKAPATPRPDAIWIGDLSSGAGTQVYCRTRAEAEMTVRGILGESLARGERVLIGFDFPFGYPRGFAAALGLGGALPWEALWRDLAARVTDDDANKNNRFDVARSYNEMITGGPGPFWGCPPAHSHGALTQTAMGLLSFPYVLPDGDLAKFRVTEVLIPGTVQEVWRLYGAGSVGSQALVGINRVARLRFDPKFSGVSQVWPFETGLAAPELPAGEAAIVFAEIWPGMVDAAQLTSLLGEGLLRDQAQVRLMCEWARGHDETGTLGTYLAPPQALADHADVVVAEEGWILGRH